VAREVPQAQLRENGKNRGYAAFASHVSGILDINAKSNVRHQRMIARRHKWADFREQRSLENFDFGFNPGINRTQVYELAACHFVRQRRDVLLVGPPGVGKSHLVQAIGLEALKAGFVVLYRSIFDLVRELLAQETQAIVS
jgi:DNA replication protein DnaC